MKLTIEQSEGGTITIQLNKHVNLEEAVEQGILPALHWYFGWDVKKKLRDLLDEE